MILSAVKLRFLTPIHLSRGKMDTYESSDMLLRSDTLHAALYVTTLDLLGPDYADKILKKLVVSSAFPFSEKGYWLPRPLCFQPDDVKHRKELKRKRYLTLDQFQRLMLGERIEISELIGTPAPQVWESDTTQRVLIDRIHHRGTPFFLEKLYPKSVQEGDIRISRHTDQGVYVWVAAEEEMPWLDGVFKLLGENGIGLQRNLGNGHFIHEWDSDFPKLQMPPSEQIRYWVNLSLFRPPWEEINSPRIRLDKSWYSLVKRGGWIASPEDCQFATLRKKSVMMFEEGSAFRFTDLQGGDISVRGELMDLRPDWNDARLHPVWRSGRAIFVPLAS